MNHPHPLRDTSRATRARGRRGAADIFAAMLILALAPISAPAGEAVDSSVKLGLALSTDRIAGPDDANVFYLVGEPVWLTIRITNWSSAPVAFSLNEALQSDVKLEACIPTTSFAEVKAPFPQASVTTVKRTLYPFDSYAFQIKLLYDPSSKPIPVLELPGRPSAPNEEAVGPDRYIRIIGRPNLVFDHESYYMLRATVSLTINGIQRASIITTPLQVHVKMPDPGSPEAKFLDALTWDAERVISFQRGVAHGEVRDFFEESFKDDPPNRYTPHILHLLGNSLRSSNPEEQTRSIAYYNQLLQAYPEYPMVHAAAEQLALLHLQRSESDKGHALFERILAADPYYFRGRETSTLTKVFLGTDPEDYHPQMWTLTP